jgi:UDP-N-acetyl-2-amino-2-deoxyglucuronate dehydrogenase
MLKFSLTGAAGYVASRHMKAIKETGNTLVSVYDPSESLSILDQYFPEAICFSDFKSFSEFHSENIPIYKKNDGLFLDKDINYLSVCSPNYAHFDQICWGLKQKVNIICEKPLVINPDQLIPLQALEKESGKKVNTILQLRLLPDVLRLKNERNIQNPGKKLEVKVEYISSRGNWYFNSWKGKEELSGGIVTNIGIHLFDLMIWLFGEVEEIILEDYTPKRAAGFLELERANVQWTLSVDKSELPRECIAANKNSFRQMLINGTPIRLDEGMENLHTACYREILSGKGTGIMDATASIKLCYTLRMLGG